MASDITFFANLSIIVATVFTLFAMISAFRQYRERKIPVTRAIFYAFTLIALASIFSCVNMVIELLAINLAAFGFFAITPFLAMVIGGYFLFIFSRIVFLGEHEHTTIENVAVVNTISVLGLYVLLFFMPNSFLSLIEILWLIFYTGVILFPIIVGTLHVRGRLPKVDPHRTNLLFLTGMAIAFLGVVVFLLMNAILIRFLYWADPTFAYPAAETCAILEVYCAQRGFFTPAKT
jgi:hypothetical protein